MRALLECVWPVGPPYPATADTRPSGRTVGVNRGIGGSGRRSGFAWAARTTAADGPTYLLTNLRERDLQGIAQFPAGIPHLLPSVVVS
jgi:hypothetical protein